MKGLRTMFLLPAVMLLVLAACREKVDPTPVQPESNVYIDTVLVVGGEANTYRFNFFSRNLWKATVEEGGGWCTVTPKDGGSGGATLGVKLSDNYDSYTRTATIRITSATHTGTIVIKQEQLDILDLTSIDQAVFEAPGGSFVINVDANISYSYKIDSPWIECVQTKALNHDKLHFTVGRNNEGVDRTAGISFSGNGIERKVTITQHPAVLNCDTRDTIMPQEGRTMPIRVGSNVSYDIVMPQLEYLRLEESAFTEVTADGVETYNLYKFVMDANPEYYARECSVIFCNSEYNVSDTLTLIQGRTDLFADNPAPEFEFSPDSVSFIIDFDAGRQFDCDAGCSWVTLVTPPGKPYRRIIQLSQNHSGSDRSCRIALHDAGRAEAIDVFQERLVMDYSRMRFDYSIGGGRDTLFFKHNIDYELVMPEEEWCRINEEEPGVFVLRVAETAEEQPRECRMIFSNDHFQIADTVVVHQGQKDVMEVSPQKIEVPSAGEEVEVHIHTNIPYDYVVEGNPDWVRENLDKSSDSLKVFFVRRNPESSDRKADIVFTGKAFKAVVTLSQRHPTLAVADSLVSFTDDGGQLALAVDTNIDFEASALPSDWLSASIKDNILQIKAMPNEGMDARKGRVVITNDFYGLSDTIAVTQSAKDVFSLSQKQFQFDPYGGSCQIKVLANVPYSYSVEEGCGWIRESAKPLSFDVDRNTSGGPRVGHIIFTDGKSATEVTVSQAAAYIRLSESELEFDTAGGSAGISVESNVKYIVGLPGCFWLKVSEVGGGLDVAAQENTSETWREAALSVTAPDFGLKVSVPVRQRQKDVFIISEKEFAFAPKGGGFKIDLHTNLDYTCTVEDQPVWLKSNGSLNYTVGKNTSGKPREAAVLIDAPGFSERVKVRQEAPVLLVSADSCVVAAEGGAAHFTVSSNIEYTEDLPSESWISREDTAEGEYSFVLSENETYRQRETYVIFITEYGLEHTVRIVQEAAEEPEVPEEPEDPDDPPVNPDDPEEPEEPVAPYITIDETDFMLGPDGGTIQLRIDSNIEYTHIIDKSADWLAEGGVPDTFVIERNTSGEGRSASIAFAGEGVRVVVNVVQNAAWINVSKTEFFLAGSGGSAELEVDANVPFVTLPPDVTWLGHRMGEDGILEISAPANPSGEARRGGFSITNTDYGISHDIVVTQSPGRSMLDIDRTDFGPEGGETRVKVYAEDYSYIFDSDCDWIHDLGNQTFAVDTYFTGAARECLVRFVAGEAADTLQVVQSAAYLDVSPGSFDDIDPYECRRTFTVKSNVDYKVSASDWITVTSSGSTVMLEVPENAGDSSRLCEVEVTTDFGLRHSFCFMQDFHAPLPPFRAKQEEFELSPVGGEVIVEITPSEGAFYNEMMMPSFITEDKERRTDSTFVFIVEAADSYRTWGITLKDAYGQRIGLKFTQPPPSVVLSSSSSLFGAEGGESLIIISSNIDYQIYIPEDQPWITYRQGAKENYYYLVASPNTTRQERTASIFIGDTLAGAVRMHKVVQSENIYLDVDTPMLRCDWEGGDLFMDLNSNVDISVVSEMQWSADKWFDVTQTETAGRFMVRVDTNYQFKPRVSTISCKAGNITKTVEIRQNGYRKEGLYYSEDFSSDRTYRILQKAVVGNGINLVIMGDAFSDRQIASGEYDSLMEEAVEYLFDIEPYRSFRDLFNIYVVTAVSPTDVYEDGAETALSTYFGSGSRVGGDDSMVRYYAQSVLSDEEMDNAVMVVLMNRPVYGGTTYLKFTSGEITDYGYGNAVSYIPLCTSREELCQVLQHEVGGHAFGKLEDEYAYERNGAISREEISNYRGLQLRGYYRNVDFTTDSASVLWSRFLYDERYRDEGLGVFEGACTYWTGAFRSSENSMMRYNTGGFNAPSREIIYYRLFRLAYGADAEYDFEDFVKYDEINRVPPTKAGQPRSGLMAPPPGFVPLPRPVILEN
ncbi:MAG: hypothetical protein KBT44_02950 [Bacteroidales bacterium]|nr:hypothetical protein [Candidatus Equibacterium intestinale]